MSADLRLTDEQIAAILGCAAELGFRGWGGACGQAALAINEVIFGNTGTLVAGLNDALASKNQWVGHVAVSVERTGSDAAGAEHTYWDADGRPRDDDDLLSWGMLDHEDLHYAETAKAFDLLWTEESANEAALFEVTEAEVREHFDLSAPHGSGDQDQQVTLLARAMEIVLGSQQNQLIVDFSCAESEHAGCAPRP